MPRPKRDLVRANFYIQNDVMEKLKSVALHKATNVSDLVRDALRKYVDEVNDGKPSNTATDGAGYTGENQQGFTVSSGVGSEFEAEG